MLKKRLGLIVLLLFVILLGLTTGFIVIDLSVLSNFLGLTIPMVYSFFLSGRDEGKS